MFRKYYQNTIHYHCQKCDKDFDLNFWQWFVTTMKFDITRHRYVKCPYCGEYHWRQAKKVM